MTSDSDRRFIELLVALDPFLNVETRKSCHAIRSLLEQFPGMSLADVAKKLAAYTSSVRRGLPALLDRGNELVRGLSEEPAQDWLADVEKLSQADFKKLAKGLDISLAGDRVEDQEHLRRWAESGGQIRPPDAKE